MIVTSQAALLSVYLLGIELGDYVYVWVRALNELPTELAILTSHYFPEYFPALESLAIHGGDSY